jgi:hypothetical protein
MRISMVWGHAPSKSVCYIECGVDYLLGYSPLSRRGRR